MSRRRRLLLVTLAALAVALAFAPMLARTGAARRLVAARLSDALGRPVEIASLDAGWTSGVALKGLVVRNDGAEFHDEPLLEAASVTIESALPTLVFSGAQSVAVDGLVVRLEEQAGGRTNVDDLVAAFAKPKPPAPKREAKPFRFRLTDASIRVRRLLHRPQPRPFDPFREDPVILDADEGLLVFGIDDLDLLLRASPGTIALQLTAAVNVAGSEGRVGIDVRLGAEGPSGRVDLEGVDLKALRAFAKGIEGRVDLHVEGSPEGADVRIRAEGLKAGGFDEAWAEVAARVRKDGDGVAFDGLALRTASDAFSLDGSGAWPPRDLRLSGHADVDLADLGPLLPEGRTLAGRLRVEPFELDGLSLKADAKVDGLVARGFSAEDLDLGHRELHVDAALSAERDVLTIARAEMDGLAAKGTVSGLMSETIRADGTVKGTLALNPLHAQLLGFREVRGLRGQVTLDVVASTGEGGPGASGTAAIDGLHVEGVRGAWDIARIAAEGSYRGGSAKLVAASDGMKLEGSLEGGKGNVALDVDAIERQPLLLGLLPADLALEGPLRLRADVARDPWDVRGTLESTGLTARFEGRGFEGETLLLSFSAREEDRGWLVAAPAITLGNLGVKAGLRDGLLGRDGSRSGRLTLEAPLERLLAFAPEAQDLAPQGALALDVLATHDGRWTFAGGADVTDGSFVLSGKRTPPRTARLEFDAVPEGDSVTLRRFRLATRKSDLEGTGSIGKAITLRMEGRAWLEEIGPYAPAFRGSGEVTLDGFALDLTEERALGASVSLRAAAVRVQGGKLTTPVLRSRVDGRLAGGSLEDVRLDVDLTAARAERGNVAIDDLVLREKGGGRSGAYSLGTRVEAKRIVIGATSWQEVGVDVRGRLDRLLGERPPSGITGTITFGRWDLGPFVWQEAKGQVEIRDGNLVVKDLVAGLHGGTVRAEGRLVPAGDRLAWEGSAHAEGVVLSEEIGRPLSFIIPFLRVRKEAGTLSGRADFDLRLAAEDTTDAAILRTLAGAGTAHLYDIEAKNSILLPLLSLRLDKAILREPYRFKDLQVAFDVGGGKIKPKPFELKATPFGINVKEIEVGLDGTVDALIVPGILPLRVHGTLDDPKVRPAPLAPFR